MSQPTDLNEPRVECPGCTGSGQVEPPENRHLHQHDPDRRESQDCVWCAGLGWVTKAEAAEARRAGAGYR